MTIKVLIVDPEIGFAVPIKRALELSGDFRVNVFASGKAASKALFRERHDIAILDFNVADLKLPDLIKALRRTQPDLNVLVSPSSDLHMADITALDVQGNITKPYMARQLLQMIQTTLGAASPESRTDAHDDQQAPPFSVPEAVPEVKRDPQIEQQYEPLEPPPSIAATLAADEPAMRPDDTFVRLIALFSSNESDKNKPIVLPSDALDGIFEPEIPEGATIRDLVSGNTPPSHMQPAQPEEPQVEPDADTPPPLAVLALEAAEDDTIPLQRIAPPNLIATGEQELDDTAAALSSWLQQIVANEQTFREPGLEPPPVESGIEPIIEQPSESAGGPQKTKPLPPLVIPPKPPSRTDSAIAQDLFSNLSVDEHHEQERPSKRRQTGSLHELLGKLIEENPGAPDPGPKRKTALLDKLIDEPSGPPPVEGPQNTVPDAVHEAAPHEAEMVPQTSTESIPEPIAELAPEPVTESSPEEESQVATLALHLTQLTVGTTAEATLVTRGNEVIASAGQIPQRTLATVLDTINAAWQSAEDPTSAIVRYLHVTGAGDYLLYSTPTAEGMALSMLFPAETPLKVIRRHAKELIAALDHVPQPAVSTAAAPSTAFDSEEPEPARTLISRPTDLRPPEGLREAIASQATDESDAAVQATPEAPAAEAPAPPPRADGPYAGYSFVWLPRVEALPAEIAGVLLDWIHAIAVTHQWELEGVEIQPGYVVVQVSIPANETPTATVETLLHETADRAANFALWADAYYIVAPSRAVTQQEIAAFVEYHQDAQTVQ